MNFALMCTQYTKVYEVFRYGAYNRFSVCYADTNHDFILKGGDETGVSDSSLSTKSRRTGNMLYCQTRREAGTESHGSEADSRVAFT
jgi:hypothetical protein